MTTFAAPRSTVAATPSPRFAGTLASVRATLRDYRHAFAAAGKAPNRTGLDYTAMLMFGRD